MDVLNKIKRRWMKLRLQPIRVFCFHQVSEQYDANVYCKPDWIPLDFLKEYVEQLQSEGYEFISIEGAYRHIQHDVIRAKKYAVLSADDGMLCQAALLPWLEERNVPITLFADLETLDGSTCTEPVKNYLKIMNKKDETKHATLLYLTGEQLASLKSPMLSVGMHGVKHVSVQDVQKDKFTDEVLICQRELSKYVTIVPFFAYPYGKHNSITDAVLRERGIVPVLIDGEKNYNDVNFIHRENLEYIYQCQNHQS